MSCLPSRKRDTTKFPIRRPIVGRKRTQEFTTTRRSKLNRLTADEWKGLVRMMKRWNNQRDKPITPSFLIEVMALDILKPSWGGRLPSRDAGLLRDLGRSHPRKLAGPGRLGPLPSATLWMLRQSRTHKQELRAAERQAADAIRLERDGKYGDALRAWRNLARAIIPALVVDLKACIDHRMHQPNRPEHVFSRTT